MPESDDPAEGRTSTTAKVIGLLGLALTGCIAAFALFATGAALKLVFAVLAALVAGMTALHWMYQTSSTRSELPLNPYAKRR